MCWNHSLLVAWAGKISLMLWITKLNIRGLNRLFLLALFSFSKKLSWLLTLLCFVSRCFYSVFIQVFKLLDSALHLEGRVGVLLWLLLIPLWVHHVGKEAILRTHWSMCMRACPLLHPRRGDFWRSKPLPCRRTLLYRFWGLVFIDHLLLARDVRILCLVYCLFGLLHLIHLFAFETRLLSAIADSRLLLWLHLHNLNLFRWLIFRYLHELVVLFVVKLDLWLRIDEHEVTHHRSRVWILRVTNLRTILWVLIPHLLYLLIPQALFIIDVLGITRYAISIDGYRFGHSQFPIIFWMIWAMRLLWETSRDLWVFSSRRGWIKVWKLTVCIRCGVIGFVQYLLHISKFLITHENQIIVHHVWCTSWVLGLDLVAPGGNHHERWLVTSSVNFAILEDLLWFMTERRRNLAFYLGTVHFLEFLMLVQLVDDRLSWSVVLLLILLFAADILSWLHNIEVLWRLLRIGHWVINWWLTRAAVLVYLSLEGICLLLLFSLLFALEEFIFHPWPLLESSGLDLWNYLFALILIHWVCGCAFLWLWDVWLIFLFVRVWGYSISFIAVSFQYFKYLLFKILFLL